MSLELSRQQRHFRRVIAAIQLAAPIAIASRYKDYRQCVAASYCGSMALATYKIKAKPISCAIVGVVPERDAIVACGLNAAEIYQYMKGEGAALYKSMNDEDLPPFNDWLGDQGKDLPLVDNALHAAIEAKYHGERAVIDLTAGQIRSGIPLTTAYMGNAWGVIRTDQWMLKYFESPRPGELVRRLAQGREVPNELTDDIKALMSIALDVDIDRTKFVTILKRIQPEMYSIASSRLNAILE